MRPRSSRFSPRLLDSDLLEQLTVAREPLLARLVGNLTAAIASGQGRFDLLVGPRGAGKSHLLGLVEARVRANPALQERVVVVSLPEEFHPSSLLHLLARVLEELPEDESSPPVRAQLAALRGRDASEATDMAVAMIRGRLRQRSLLLMLENLDAIFRDLGRKAQARLRKIIQTEQGWSIFATARTAIALTKQTEPFHGTFVVEQLEVLTPEQCREMMVRLARVHEQVGLQVWLDSDAALTHVRATHHLVGGSPRVVAMLFHHLDAERLDDLEGNFYRLAEEVTPYFQEQMNRLSAGQRPVMEFLAERWAPASVKEIAEGTFNEPTTVSTHLRALRRDRLVHSLAVGKERFYEIAEPLHRIARAMKEDRRLGAAVAHMAQVWTMLGAANERAALSPTWLARFCEWESEYVKKIVAQLTTAWDTNDPAIEEYIEALLQHAQGHPPQAVAIYALMCLGRDNQALMTAQVMAEAGLHAQLSLVYLAWLADSPHGSRCPSSEMFLSHAFIGTIISEDIQAFITLIASDTNGMTRMLWRIAERLGTSVAAKLIETMPNDVDDLQLAGLTSIAWMRQELGHLLGSNKAVKSLCAAIERSHSDPGNPVSLGFRALQECLALENTTLAASPNPGPIPAVIDDANICIPLWIASGRDISTLRRSLEVHADRLHFSAAFEHALATEDTSRAFARLGAESRAFARDFLRVFELDDLLARLPDEPTVDSD